MRSQHILLSALVSFVFGLSSCTPSNDQVGKGNPNANVKTKKSEDADGDVVEAKSAKGDAKGKGTQVGEEGDDATYDTKGGKDADESKGANDAGTTDAGKDGDEPAATDAVDGDDEPTKGGKDGKDGNDPGQNPGQTPPQSKPPMEDPEVVVELPAGKCPYLDPAAPAFVIAANQFGQNLPPIAVPSANIQGELQADGETYISAFTLYQLGKDSAQFSLTWDGKAGRIPNDYTLVVVGASNDKCTAFLKLVKQEPRTLNGCFDLATKIRMADGKDRVIAAISKGDMVLNPITKQAVKVAEVVKGEEKNPMWDIGFGGSHMVITEKHPVPTKAGLKMAKDVTAADYIYDHNGIIHRVTTAKALPVKRGQIVVNVRLDSGSANADHMIVAGGVLSGDLYLQRKLAGANTAATK